ncbi:tRNA dihydrouridine synthase [Helicobacter pametensis]|uniref:tRNA dihydrouridine synthase n=1 Tax=Helicobacter pametensis TaxID=95149 RepID=UPI00048751D2|nr:tRNA-dihydrouridine synthase [Helicobacter pametensis]
MAKLHFDNLLMLAPLAGFTDLPFRSVVKKFGVDLTVSEMISSHALAYQSQKTLKMVEKSPLEDPYSVQISGSKEEILLKAVQKLNEIDGIDVIDFNCGCPAPKVANHGNGSGLLKDLKSLVRCVQLIKATSNKPYTSIKVRLGFDTKIPEDIAHAINDSGADFCVVHGRTRSDGYKKERIDYASIALMKSIVRCPLIANGEIDSPKKAQEVLDLTGANGVMIGRAALQKPWIFWQIKHNTQELPPMLKKELVLEHFDLMMETYGEYGCVMFRKNLHAYAKGEKDAGKYRDLVNSLKDPKEMRESIEEFFSSSHLSEIPQIIRLNQKTI